MIVILNYRLFVLLVNVCIPSAEIKCTINHYDSFTTGNSSLAMKRHTKVISVDHDNIATVKAFCSGRSQCIKDNHITITQLCGYLCPLHRYKLLSCRRLFLFVFIYIYLCPTWYAYHMTLRVVLCPGQIMASHYMYNMMM